jgi:hypothetical protein
MSTASGRRPATLSPVPPTPVFARVLRYLAIGLSFYVCILCIGFGVYQFTYASIPTYRALGVDIKRVVKQVRDDDDLGPVLAGAEARLVGHWPAPEHDSFFVFLNKKQKPHPFASSGGRGVAY